jgi:hypothetical protein
MTDDHWCFRFTEFLANKIILVFVYAQSGQHFNEALLGY